MTEPISAPILTVRAWEVGWSASSLVGPLDLDVRAGECVAIVGPSGSGKTTLLRSWAGLLDPTAGALRFEGTAPEGSRWPRVRRRLHYVAQRPTFHDQTVRACLERPFTFEVSERPFDEAEASEVLQQLGLEPDIMERLAGSLSEGEQQRVALARALLLRPACLLLDEPTSALDEHSRSKVEALLEARRESSKLAIVWITHDRQQASRVSDSCLELGKA